MLTARDILTLDIVRDTGRKPTVSAQNYLQVVTQIVTRHCQQQRLKVNAAS